MERHRPEYDMLENNAINTVGFLVASLLLRRATSLMIKKHATFHLKSQFYPSFYPTTLESLLSLESLVSHKKANKEAHQRDFTDPVDHVVSRGTDTSKKIVPV